MELQPFTQKDLLNIPTIQPADWPDISPYFVFYLQNPTFCFPIKMIRDSEMIGTGALIQNRNTCWLAHIIVKPEYRGKGLGYQITEELVRMSKEKNCDTVSLIATTLGRPIYEKLGFREQGYYQLFTGPKLDSISVNGLLVDIASAEQIYSLDKAVSGEDRIDTLRAVINSGKIYRNGSGEMEGYYLPALGEGLIYARSFNAAKALFSLRFKKEENKIGLPEANEDGIRFLKDHGFVFRDRIVRMFLGKQLKWQPSMIYSRAGGFYG